ncbi:MAG TPA: phage tail protein [Rhodobacteraceae bacterium]|jgi:head-tail adaptor|nr:phage tail protein [Paracoccaceae bacterium]
MKAPLLNRKLVLEHAVQTPDGSGGFGENWVALGTLWAEITAGSGSEKAGEFITVSSVPYRITVRGAPVGAESRPKPDQRFRDGSRLFLIKAVTERDPQAHYLTCFAIEEEAS